MIILVCPTCKKEFKTYPYRQIRSSVVYCSGKCRVASHHIKVKCKLCKKRFPTLTWLIKAGRSKYCSLKCRLIANKINFTKENNPNWKGGRSIIDGGYIYIRKPDHPYATKRGYIAEHRLVMEKILGRYLLLTERIDHINHHPSDNTPENLKLYSSQSTALRADMEIIKFVKQRFGSLEGLKKTMVLTAEVSLVEKEKDTKKKAEEED